MYARGRFYRKVVFVDKTDGSDRRLAVAVNILLEEILLENKEARVPKHIAMFMDGNGRWATSRGLPRMIGHRQGSENMRTIIKECLALGIRYLTLYAFSTENWRRPKEEVDYLMSLPGHFFEREKHLLQEEQVKVVAIGDLDGVPDKTRNVVKKIQDMTAGYDRLTVLLAFNYGSRNELVAAASRLAQRALEQNQVDFTEADMANELYTAGYPDPDLVIRCGGEMRMSNFLLWQAAYAELYFTKTLWPDFKGQELRLAIADYQSRDRRFGGLSATKNSKEGK